MRLFTYICLFMILIYTIGFGVSLWKEKQKISAIAVFFLTLGIVVLPFFSILK